MDNIKVRDVKKALRLCGWKAVRIHGEDTIYSSPYFPGYFTIKGKESDVISPALLIKIERQLGQCLGSVFA